jgi:Holliday junction resolvase
MVNPSKKKGSKFESDILQKLREIIPETARTPGSGCSYRDQGDIINYREYLIECKHHKEVSWGKLMRFWEQSKKSAANVNRVPLLIYKENNQPIMVMALWMMPGQEGGVHIVPFDSWFMYQKYLFELTQDKVKQNGL